METIQEAKYYIDLNVEKGVTCPCCGQYNKVYKRRITSTIARGLLEMHNHKLMAYVKVKDWLENQGLSATDITKAALWDFIEPQEGSRKDGSKRNGYWRLTNKGMLFCSNRWKVNKYVYEYRTKRRFYSGKKVLIEECLGVKFNYNEIMKF